MMKTNDFPPSVYQQRVLDFIAHEKGNAIVNAVAGSGKTTLLLQAAAQMINFAVYMGKHPNISHRVPDLRF